MRGPWIAASLLTTTRARADAFHDGWFRTGDVVTIDADGYVQITDRAKDVIKSGGEWISSVELENLIMGHPDVLEAAVIGLPHERWQERPLACVVPKPRAGRRRREDILDYLAPRVARWWLPDDVVFVDDPAEDERRQARQARAARAARGAPLARRVTRPGRAGYDRVAVRIATGYAARTSSRTRCEPRPRASSATDAT